MKFQLPKLSRRKPKYKYGNIVCADDTIHQVLEDVLVSMGVGEEDLKKMLQNLGYSLPISFYSVNGNQFSTGEETIAFDSRAGSYRVTIISEYEMKVYGINPDFSIKIRERWLYTDSPNKRTLTCYYDNAHLVLDTRYYINSVAQNIKIHINIVSDEYDIPYTKIQSFLMRGNYRIIELGVIIQTIEQFFSSTPERITVTLQKDNNTLLKAEVQQGQYNQMCYNWNDGIIWLSTDGQWTFDTNDFRLRLSSSVESEITVCTEEATLEEIEALLSIVDSLKKKVSKLKRDIF